MFARNFHFTFRVAVCMSLLAISAMVISCVGQKARDDVGVPAVKLAAPQIQTEAICGVALLPTEQQASASASVDAFFAATQGDTATTQGITQAYHQYWSMVQDAAQRCIEHRRSTGELGPDVVISLQARLAKFERNLKSLANESPPTSTPHK